MKIQHYKMCLVYKSLMFWLLLKYTYHLQVVLHNSKATRFWTMALRIILGPVYDNEKENWRILTNKEIYAMVKKPTITETIKLNRLHWFGHVERMEWNRIPKKVLYMNLKATRLRGRPRKRWQGEVRDDGRLDGGKGWKERVYNRKEWKKLQRTARNRHILHMLMEWMKTNCLIFVGLAELNLLHITLQAPRILRQLLDFWKMYALLHKEQESNLILPEHDDDDVCTLALKYVLDKWDRHVSHFQSAFYWYNFQALSHTSKKSLLPSSKMPVCPSVNMY